MVLRSSLYAVRETCTGSSSGAGVSFGSGTGLSGGASTAFALRPWYWQVKHLW